MSGIDELSPFASIFFRDQLGRWRRRKIGIGIEASPILIRQFLGLDEQMPIVGGKKPHLFQIVAFEHIEHLQCGDSLAGRRQLPNVVASVIRRHGFDPGRSVIGKIAVAEKAADAIGISNDLLGDRAAIKSIAAALSDGRDTCEPGWDCETTFPPWGLGRRSGRFEWRRRLEAAFSPRCANSRR